MKITSVCRKLLHFRLEWSYIEIEDASATQLQTMRASLGGQLVYRPLIFCALMCLQAEPLVSVRYQGRVSDVSGRPVSGALVVLTPGVSASTLTSGEFLLTVAPGSYRLSVTAPGFDAYEKLVEVRAGIDPVEIVLQVTGIKTAITVVETPEYTAPVTSTATKTPTQLVDIPQAITVVGRELIKDQLMAGMADVVRYTPGITMAQGEGHRDAPVIRGNATTADFYVNGVRDDVQYMRDLYNVERVEAVKGPNAMIFGRGGGGGVINRVTKEAVFAPFREILLQGGSFGNKRVSSDLNQTLFGDKLAFRLNGAYENSNSFRNYGNIERYGIAPTVTMPFGQQTRVKLGYEYFRDQRVTDRGIPSFNSLPLASAHRSTFFGNPSQSPADAGVHLGSATVEHQQGKLNLRNSTLIGSYDKFYQNVFPGAVNAAATLVGLSGYNTGTQRLNVFNQSDATYLLATGPVRHTLLAGAEIGRQATDNLRQTGYFNGTAAVINVPVSNPTDFTPISFRMSATDANNRAVSNIAAGYVQDQVSITRFVQLVGGLRFDRFDLHVLNNRNLDRRRRVDYLWSPRVGLVFKPVTPMSVYANYSVSYLPSAGDQFASLDATSETLKPEKFTNYEAGFKWDIRRSLALTSAVYGLDRTNTRAVNPNNPAQILQTGAQRTNGFELGLNGTLTSRWTVAGGYGYQDAFIHRATAAAVQGAKVPLVPLHTFSMWNNVRVMRRLSGGLGLIHQQEMWAGIDNTVRIPQFTRADAAVFYSLTEKLRLQANVENLTDRKYFSTAHSNNNITPGFARAVRIGLTVRF
jgi:catecholate siderophore receptor